VRERPPQPGTTRVPAWALLGAAGALSAVGLEVTASLLGQGVDTRWPGWLTPIAWPTPLCVAVGLAAAAGAGAATVGLDRAGVLGRSARLAGAGATVLFAAFAAGVAAGAAWATWH
jgi:hypothetical protein